MAASAHVRNLSSFPSLLKSWYRAITFASAKYANSGIQAHVPSRFVVHMNLSILCSTLTQWLSLVVICAGKYRTAQRRFCLMLMTNPSFAIRQRMSLKLEKREGWVDLQNTKWPPIADPVLSWGLELERYLILCSTPCMPLCCQGHFPFSEIVIQRCSISKKIF